VITNEDTFLYNTGQIDSLTSPNWIRRQTYTVTRIKMKDRKRHSDAKRKVIGKDLTSPPCNIGRRSTPNYAALATAAIHPLPSGETVFAGQRLDAFYVDLGSIFDLGDLRPFQNLHLIPSAASVGINALRNFNVHTLAIQVPIATLTVDGNRPMDVADPKAVIGVWTSASRRKGTVRDADGQHDAGPFVQVSRLGNPLFNEVIVPMSDKDRWNRLGPDDDKDFAKYVANPELAGLLPVLYPGVFPNLAALNAAKTPRADLLAILLTGIPSGIIPGFQNFTGTTQADELRLNVAVPPAAKPSVNGILGGDLAGFPNGRRIFDNIVTIELQAIAGATVPLVDASFTPDGAASLVNDGTVFEESSHLTTFPYLGHPKSGFEVTPLGVGAT
jgi:hypothetical protein